MRASLRDLAWRAAPDLMADRAARYERGLRAEWGLPELADAFIAAHGDRVLTGPVRGLRYTRTGDAPVAKLLGAYEHEIAPWLELALSAQPPLFVDLGAADGYYAVGVKLRCAATRVVAYELAATARRELEALAALNEVSIEIRARATAQSLRDLDLSDGLVLCDIEGAEADVLLPRSLASCTIIVELHDHLRPGVTDLLVDRFDRSHGVEFVHSTSQDRGAYPALEALPEAQRASALSEHRTLTTWARFTPR